MQINLPTQQAVGLFLIDILSILTLASLVSYAFFNHPWWVPLDIITDFRGCMLVFFHIAGIVCVAISIYTRNTTK